MKDKVRVFWGIDDSSETKADELLDSILLTLLQGFKNHYDVEWKEFEDLKSFLYFFREKHPTHSYIADWVEKEGYSKIQNMNESLLLIEDVENFLIYQKFCLEIDVFGESRYNFDLALIEIISIISNHIEDFKKCKGPFRKFFLDEQ